MDASDSITGASFAIYDATVAIGSLALQLHAGQIGVKCAQFA